MGMLCIWLLVVAICRAGGFPVRLRLARPVRPPASPLAVRVRGATCLASLFRGRSKPIAVCQRASREGRVEKFYQQKLREGYPRLYTRDLDDGWWFSSQPKEQYVLWKDAGWKELPTESGDATVNVTCSVVSGANVLVEAFWVLEGPQNLVPVEANGCKILVDLRYRAAADKESEKSPSPRSRKTQLSVMVHEAFCRKGGNDRDLTCKISKAGKETGFLKTKLSRRWTRELLELNHVNAKSALVWGFKYGSHLVKEWTKATDPKWETFKVDGADETLRVTCSISRPGGKIEVQAAWAPRGPQDLAPDVADGCRLTVALRYGVATEKDKDQSALEDVKRSSKDLQVVYGGILSKHKREKEQVVAKPAKTEEVHHYPAWESDDLMKFD